MNYAVSDFHGRYDLYKKLLETLNLSDEDTLYILGDFVDRGPEGLKILLDMAQRDNVVGIMGNHDYIARHVLVSLENPLVPEKLVELRELLSAWEQDGGLDTFREYKALSPEDRNLAIRMLGSLSPYEEVLIGKREFVLCHSGICGYDESKPLDEYEYTDFIIEREDYSKPKFAKEGKFLVTGHTPTIAIDMGSKGKIYKNHDHIAIDCGAVFGFGLGCICLDTMEEIYIK